MFSDVVLNSHLALLGSAKIQLGYTQNILATRALDFFARKITGCR